MVFEAVALSLSAGGVVGEVLALLTRPGRLLLEALVQGRPVVSLPLLPTVAARPARLRVQIKQFASVTRTLWITPFTIMFSILKPKRRLQLPLCYLAYIGWSHLNVKISVTLGDLNFIITSTAQASLADCIQLLKSMPVHWLVDNIRFV